MGIIYHYAEAPYVKKHYGAPYYVPPGYEKDGFIHCTKEPEVLERVAFNLEGKKPGDYMVLFIEEEKIEAPVKYESPNGRAPYFPHIYGRLNADAIREIRPFKRDGAGRFIFPCKPRIFNGTEGVL